MNDLEILKNNAGLSSDVDSHTTMIIKYEDMRLISIMI